MRKLTCLCVVLVFVAATPVFAKKKSEKGHAPYKNAHECYLKLSKAYVGPAIANPREGMSDGSIYVRGTHIIAGKGPVSGYYCFGAAGKACFHETPVSKEQAIASALKVAEVPDCKKSCDAEVGPEYDTVFSKLVNDRLRNAVSHYTSMNVGYARAAKAKGGADKLDPAFRAPMDIERSLKGHRDAMQGCVDLLGATNGIAKEELGYLDAVSPCVESLAGGTGSSPTPVVEKKSGDGTTRK